MLLEGEDLFQYQCIKLSGSSYNYIGGTKIKTEKSLCTSLVSSLLRSVVHKKEPVTST